MPGDLGRHEDAVAQDAPQVRGPGEARREFDSPFQPGRHRAQAEGKEILATLIGSASAGVNPRVMGIGPVPATEKVLARYGWRVDQLDLIELNEAFAAQSLAVTRTLGLDESKVNINGGAIALGHPLGCSGARILTTLIYALRARGGGRGLATLCVGVGQGVATLIEV